MGDAIVLLGFSDVETIERYAGEFHSFIEKQAQDREQRQEHGTPETSKLEQYLVGYLPKMLERLADVQARSHKLGSLVPEHLEEFHGQVELRGLNVCTLSVSLDIVLIHHILVGLFSADYEQIFDEPPYEDAISEFLSMLAASTASQLEKSGFEYKSSTPTGWFAPEERENDLRRNHGRPRYRRFRLQYVGGGNLKQKSVVIGNGIFRSLGDDTNQDCLNTGSVEISKCAHQFVMTVLKADSRQVFYGKRT